METLKYPACTVRWVARLGRSWPSPEKATQIFYGGNLIGTIVVKKDKKKSKVVEYNLYGSYE